MTGFSERPSLSRVALPDRPLASAGRRGSPGRYSQPSTPISERDRGARRGRSRSPGTPLAWASCRVCPNVSLSPGCTKTSNDAMAAASADPSRWPRNTASGSSPSNRALLGPSPTITRRAHREVAERGEVLDLLLRGEAADVSDHDLGTPRGAQSWIATRRSEAFRVDAPPPVAYTIHPECGELLSGVRRRSERHGRASMQARDVRLGDARGRGHPVALRVGRHVGLVGGDAGDPDPRGRRAPPANRARTARRGARHPAGNAAGTRRCAERPTCRP